MLAYNLGPERVYELVGRAFRTAWATSICMTFVISWSVSGAMPAGLRGVRCCFDAAVKTLPASSYTTFHASSTFPNDTKSTNFLFNSASLIATFSTRLLPSYTLEGDGSNVPARTNNR